MRVPLVEFAPKWLKAEPHRARQGLSFLCPVCGNHRFEVWLAAPLDAGGAVTATVGRLLAESSGSTFDNLTLYTDELECGADWVFLKRGCFVVG